MAANSVSFTVGPSQVSSGLYLRSSTSRRNPFRLRNLWMHLATLSSGQHPRPPQNQPFQRVGCWGNHERDRNGVHCQRVSLGQEYTSQVRIVHEEFIDSTDFLALVSSKGTTVSWVGLVSLPVRSAKYPLRSLVV